MRYGSNNIAVIYGGDFEYEDATQYYQNIDAMIDTIHSLVWLTSITILHINNRDVSNSKIGQMSRRSSTCTTQHRLAFCMLSRKRTALGQRAKAIFSRTPIVHTPFGLDSTPRDPASSSTNDLSALSTRWSLALTYNQNIEYIICFHSSQYSLFDSWASLRITLTFIAYLACLKSWVYFSITILLRKLKIGSARQTKMFLLFT